MTQTKLPPENPGRFIANTVTIYEFTDAEKLRHLEVYIMPRGERVAQ